MTFPAAIKLARVGDYALVSVIAKDGTEAVVIRERLDGAFSHIVEPRAIANALRREVAQMPGLSIPTEAPAPCLGGLAEGGAIWTTCGWSFFGPAWVLETQVSPALDFGWRRTGKTGEFQGYTLVELVRDAVAKAGNQ